MRFVDYSFALLQTALERLRAGQPINVRHYNGIIAWFALAHDALLDPSRHVARSSNEGSLGDLLFATITAPAPLGDSAQAALAGVARVPAGAPVWQQTIGAGLSGAARELARTYRFLPERTEDAVPGGPVFRAVGLGGDFAWSAIDPTALDLATVVWLHPSTITTILALRSTITAMLRALVNGQDAQLPALAAGSPQLVWLADERRVSAMRSEATMVVVLIAMLVALSWLGRKKPRAVSAQREKAGPIRMPGPNQPIGRTGSGPARLA